MNSTRREYALDGSFEDIELTDEEQAQCDIARVEGQRKNTIQSATAALIVSDKYIRISVEEQMPISKEVLAYRATLRAIASGAEEGPLPSEPLE